MKNAETDLSWVDEFWDKAGAHIFARAEDGVLILPPNRVYKLNQTGVKLIDHLKCGGRMAGQVFPDSRARTDVAAFFGDLAALYRGDSAVNGTVSDVNYGFDFTKLPVLAELALTYRCNNACLFCYAGCGSAPPVENPVAATAAAALAAAALAAAAAVAACVHRPELPVAAFKHIIDIFADDAHVPFFSFTGGEPTLRPDLEELIAYATKRRLATNLVTNATLIDKRRADDLKRAGLGSAQVSVEAPDATLHDHLVGRVGAFTATIAGLSALQAAGIPTQTNTTLTRLNIGIADAMPAFLAALGIERFAMNLFIPTVRSPATADLFVSYSDIGPTVDAVVRAAKRAGLVFFWYSPTPFCLYNPLARGLGNKSCAAADGLLSVAPDGAVLPCSSWDESLGNLSVASFRSVWFSGAAADLKNKRFAPADCRDDCSAFAACQGACPLYWRYSADGDRAQRRAYPCAERERSVV